ncbi:MAG TPA: sulfite exporter TauE/SafE family protein [Alphaproteobacteria bacterium]|nr:sulfite exporter TauE/SafE family protein [Alphaproteobacteria bacterium]
MADPLLLDPIWLAGFALALLATGAFAGLLAGLLGVGGGIVIVPVLYHLFTALGIDEAVRMHVAVATSLATIVPTSLVSARAHHGRGAVDPALLKRWGPALLLGVVAGSALGGQAKGAALTAIFGAVALLVSANMAFGREGASLRDGLPGRAAQAAIAFVIGGFSTVMGIGGGTLSVPVLSLFRYPIRRAVGTAAAIGVVISVPGALLFGAAGLGEAGRPPGSLGYVNLLGFAAIVPTTMLLAPHGARLAHSIGTLWLRRAFAFFLFATALRMLGSLL